MALMVVQSEYEKHGQDHRVVITSALDGKHSAGSLHYVGYAVDIRMPLESVDAIIHHIKLGLGYDFDVVNEGDHLHIEFQPKEAY